MKKGYIIGIALIVLMLSISAVSAGFLDGLTGGSSSSNANSIPMQTQEIGGLFRISAPTGSNFVDDGQTAYGPSYKNNGEHSPDITYIVFAPYEFDSLTSGQNKLYEQDGDITVYQDIGMSRIFYVDRHVNGSTVSLMGTDLDLMKEMANSVEIL